MALAFLVESAWQTWSAVHLERDLGASPGMAALGPAVFGASAGIGRVLVHRRAVPGREAGLVALGALVAAVASVAAALVPVTALVIVAIAFAGLGTAAGAPLLLSLCRPVRVRCTRPAPPSARSRPSATWASSSRRPRWAAWPAPPRCPSPSPRWRSSPWPSPAVPRPWAGSRRRAEGPDTMGLVMRP